MGETLRRSHPEIGETNGHILTADQDRQLTSKWRLDYFERKSNFWYVIKDDHDNPVRAIQGQQARLLRQILTVQSPNVTRDMVDAFRPLILEAFADEVGLYEEDQAYQDRLESKQPKQYPGESSEDVYRRFWTGYLMRCGVSAEEVAEKIIKNEDRVRVAVAWGKLSQADIREKTQKLASVIREFHPNGPRGK